MPVGVEPEGMAVSPDGKILVNTSETTNMAHLIDTQTKQIVANILVDARPRFAQFKPDGSELWVSSEVGGTVAVIDPVEARRSSRRSPSKFPACRKRRSSRSAFPSRRTASAPFVALGPANRVAVDRRRDARRSRNICSSASASGIWRFTPDEKYLLTANGVSNDVSVIDVASLKVVKSIPVGAFPWGVVVAPQ